MTTQNDSTLDTASAQEMLLIEKAARALDSRRDAGLDGLVEGLDSVIITTETDHLVPAIYELLRYTGLACTEAFFNADSQGLRARRA
ncbi:MAG: hypothetical protein WC620_07595 [Methanoregula sp.]|jgi:hypothetical protein